LFAVGAALAISACDDDGPPLGPTTASPAGGTLTFPNGIKLDFPPNAVSRNIDIVIEDLSCESTDAVLANSTFRTHEQSCLRGFSAEPAGTTFAVPVTAWVPVRALEPGEIPVLIEQSESGTSFLIAETDLRYHPAESVLEIRNLTHFSEVWTMAFAQFVEDSCRRCDSYNTVIVPPKDGNPAITMAHLCNAYAIDFWRGQQSGCCLLLQQQRSSCAPACECCTELGFDVRASDMDQSAGDCQVVASDVSVTFPHCADSTPQSHGFGAVTPECPEDMSLELEVSPEGIELYVCQEVNLDDRFQVKLTGKSDEETVFGPMIVPATWSSADPSIALVGGSGITGMKEGQTVLTARVSQDPELPTVDVNAKVSCVDLELSVTEAIIKVGEVLSIEVIGLMPDGTMMILPESEIEWSSDNTAVAIVDPPRGYYAAEIGGVSTGEAIITASWNEDACGTRRATAHVKVILGPAGIWHLTPITQHERCRYLPHDWWVEDPFGPFDIELRQPRGEQDPYLEANYVGVPALVLTGTYDAESGSFDLGIDTSNAPECEYMFYADEEDLCGDAIDCRMESCRNTTTVTGSIAADAATLDAESTWYYQVTISVAATSGRVETTWECEGSASYLGAHQ
jgi:hypothetical protein